MSRGDRSWAETPAQISASSAPSDGDLISDGALPHPAVTACCGDRSPARARSSEVPPFDGFPNRGRGRSFPRRWCGSLPIVPAEGFAPCRSSPPDGVVPCEVPPWSRPLPRMVASEEMMSARLPLPVAPDLEKRSPFHRALPSPGGVSSALPFRSAVRARTRSQLFARVGRPASRSARNANALGPGAFDPWPASVRRRLAVNLFPTGNQRQGGAGSR
jgi:hypothetical protein